MMFPNTTLKDAVDDRDALRKLYSQVKKRLSDEFCIELDSVWEARVVGGEHDVPLPDIPDMCSYTAMSRALRNVSMLARRMKRYVLNPMPVASAAKIIVDVDHIIRFCEEVGVTSSVLREGDKS